MDKHFIVSNQNLVFTGQKPATSQEALDLSIEKWQYIVDHVPQIIFDGGADTCGLCMFHGLCIGCPISLDTGQDQCRGTSYYDFCHTRLHPRDDELGLVYARQMVSYLTGLKERGK